MVGNCWLCADSRSVLLLSFHCAKVGANASLAVLGGTVNIRVSLWSVQNFHQSHRSKYSRFKMRRVGEFESAYECINDECITSLHVLYNGFDFLYNSAPRTTREEDEGLASSVCRCKVSDDLRYQ